MPSWRRETWESKDHTWDLERPGAYFMCGLKAPRNIAQLEPGDGLICENCAKAESRRQDEAAGKRKPLIPRTWSGAQLIARREREFGPGWTENDEIALQASRELARRVKAGLPLTGGY